MHVCVAACVLCARCMLDCNLFPRGWSQKLLNARFDHAGWVGGSQIGAESARASGCTRAGGWVGGTLSFCTVPVPVRMGLSVDQVQITE